jgi:hypothetical protein
MNSTPPPKGISVTGISVTVHISLPHNDCPLLRPRHFHIKPLPDPCLCKRQIIV